MTSNSTSGGHAFDQIIPLASASVASSSRTKPMPYHVFINHYGQDVKNTLGSTIYNSLDATGLRVFLDKAELKHGDFFPLAIEEAIRSASLHIAIFSEHYAQSPWCLAELALMIETGETIVPVFYHVEPSDLRWAIEGKGKYVDAFSEHEKKGRIALEELQRWKVALHNVSFYHGYIIKNMDDEQRVVKNVMNRVLKEMETVPLEVAKHPVGLDEAVRDFDTIAVQSGGPSGENAQIVGIWGMGGSGKTTLAKELYNKRCSAMDLSSFLSDVRDAAERGLLLEKQKTLLKDLHVKDVSFDNLHRGKQILNTRVESASVLIVLDDVGHPDQLDTLLPAIASLGRGSLIIVTTREFEVLQSRGISAIYQLRALNPTHARQLFCWHAFLQPSPLPGFENLVEEFLNSCHGLPLSLKVLGGQLYGRSDKDYWQRTLKKYSRILPNDIKERLKISYDSLDEEEKEMFLDTASFFIGQRSSTAIAVWDASNWDGLLGWERLLNKCLIEIDEGNRIKMHDHLRDLGRDVANRQSPYRVWFREQIIKILPQQERIRIRGITNAIGDKWYSPQGEIIINTNQGVRGLTPCSVGLKILICTGHYINQENGELPRELVWLRCYQFLHNNLPSWLSLQNLRILELHGARNLQDLWGTDANAPLQLRELRIVNCGNFRGFPKSIGDLRHLKEIWVKPKYSEMINLPNEFSLLRSPEHLQLSRCRKISSLPRDFGNLVLLRHLDLSYCSQLTMLSHSFKQLILLEYLNLEGCLELIFKSEDLDILEHMTKLEYLNLNECRKVELLPLPSGVSLTQLYLKGTRLRELPVNIGHLSKLPVLEISSELLRALPTSVGNLSSLTALKVSSCPNLESLPTSLWHLSSLTELEIASCGKLHSLPDTLGCFNLSGPTCMIKKINITSTKVSKISISEECCPCLVTLSLRYNHLLREVEILPRTVETINVEHCDFLENLRCISHLEKLQAMTICYCPTLDGLPSFAKLFSLKDFELVDCPKVKKVEGMEGLGSLEKIKIIDCGELEALPRLAQLISLKTLNLGNCPKLEMREDLERLIERLRSLKKLKIVACPRLDAVPKSLEELYSG